MKIAGAILIISLAIFGCLVMTTAAETTATIPDSIPNLTGIWKGTSFGHGKLEGFGEKPMTFNITEQNGQAFTGVKEYDLVGESLNEGFSGIITEDGTIFMGDYEDGSQTGKLIGANEMIIYYIESGEDAKAKIIKLTR
jgi:hypothetical protein